MGPPAARSGSSSRVRVRSRPRSCRRAPATRLFAIASPSPEPRDSGERAKRSNTCASSSGAIPRPVSVTRKATPRSSGSAAIVTVPPEGVWRSAFETRFASTSPIRTRSTSSAGRSGATWVRSVTPRSARLRPVGGLGGLDELAGLEPLAVQAQRAGLGVREQLEVVEQPRHHRGLGADQREVVAARLVQPVGHPLDVRPRITESGVRSSCATSASRLRRCSSLVSSRSAIRLKARARSRTSGGPCTVALARVVALGDARRRIHDLADRSRGPAHEPAEREEADEQQDREGQEPRAPAAPTVEPAAERRPQPSGDEHEQEEQPDPDRNPAEEPSAHRAPVLGGTGREGLVRRATTAGSRRSWHPGRGDGHASANR